MDANGQPTIPRQPDINVYLVVDGQKRFVGKTPLSLPAQIGGEADFISSAQVPLASGFRGIVGELILELSIPATEPPHVGFPGEFAKVWIDNVRLGPYGSPLQAEVPAQVASSLPGPSSGDFSVLVERARSEWMNLVDIPDWRVGFALWNSGISTLEFATVNRGDVEEGRNTGGGERGFNNQRFLTDLDISVLKSTIPKQWTGSAGIWPLGSIFDASVEANQAGRDGNTSLSSDSNAVQSKDDSNLVVGKDAVFGSIVMDHDGANHSIIHIGRSVVDNSTSGSVSDVNIGSDLSSDGSNWTPSDLDVLNLEEVSFQVFKGLPLFRRDGSGLINGSPLVNITAPLAQSEDQQNQNTLQHNLSFGTLTLPPDRDSVNTVAGNGQWSMANGQLTAEQLNLLSRATVTIADLADGYLALTLGTTITLDTDAAGYGWFIDPTPFTNEEFVNGWSMVDGQWSVGSDSSRLAVHDSRFTSAGEAPWQFFAKPDSAAEGKMDLLTTVMHELGHVLGLGDQSPTHTLMSETLDPGIRRMVTSYEDYREVRGFHSFQADPVAGVNGVLGAALRQQATVLLPRRPADRPDRILSTLPSEGLIDWDGACAAHSHTTDVSFFVPTKKPSWLHRFLLNLAAHEDELDPNHDLEVVLPGKKS